MSLTVLNKKFLAVLLDLGIDISEFPDKTFDGLFETGCNESNLFLEWFCENVSGDNVLTDEERSAYDELRNVNRHVSEEDLEKCMRDCHPSYEDVKGLDSDYVDVLTNELEVLDNEYQDLLNVKYSLDLQLNDIKKEQITLLEESHKWKSNLVAAKKDCYDINADINNVLKDVSVFLLKSPSTHIDLNDEEFNNDLPPADFLTSDQNFSLLSDHRNPYESLEEKLSIIEHCKILSLGKLEQKKTVHSNLEKVIRNKKSSDAYNVMDSFCSPKSANACEKLKDEILGVERNELVSATSKLSNLELSRACSHFQLNKLYSVNNLITKATYYKESLEINEAFNLLLLHILRRSVENVNKVSDLVTKFSENLRKNRTGENDKIEFLNWKRRRYDEVSNVMKEKHPLMTALKEKVPDITDETVPKVSCSMKLFIDNSVLCSRSIYDEAEDQIRKYAAKLLCGPTKQLQFTDIEIQKKFHACDYLLIQRKNEVKKLANKYLSFKNAVAQGNRTKSLLWTLFLTNPDKLEYVVKNIEKETVAFESKYSPGDVTLL